VRQAHAHGLLFYLETAMSQTTTPPAPPPAGREQTPFERGYNAYLVQGTSPMSNPFHACTPEYQDWAKGYDEARQTYETDR
jgi:hypothetical protein